MDYFDYTGFEDTPNTGFDWSIEDWLEQSEEEQKQRLEDELKRIQQQLDQRERIHEESVSELESKRDRYIERLQRLYKQNFGKQGEKQRLKQGIEEFYAELRKEKRVFWRDIQELEKEKRDLLTELDEVDDLSDLWESIL